MYVAFVHLEPYKGKGIRYVGESVRRKEGKTGGNNVDRLFFNQTSSYQLSAST